MRDIDISIESDPNAEIKFNETINSLSIAEHHRGIKTITVFTKNYEAQFENKTSSLCETIKLWEEAEKLKVNISSKRHAVFISK